MGDDILAGRGAVTGKGGERRGSVRSFVCALQVANRWLAN